MNVCPWSDVNVHVLQTYTLHPLATLLALVHCLTCFTARSLHSCCVCIHRVFELCMQSSECSVDRGAVRVPPCLCGMRHSSSVALNPQGLVDACMSGALVHSMQLSSDCMSPRTHDLNTCTPRSAHHLWPLVPAGNEPHHGCSR